MKKSWLFNYVSETAAIMTDEKIIWAIFCKHSFILKIYILISLLSILCILIYVYFYTNFAYPSIKESELVKMKREQDAVHSQTRNCLICCVAEWQNGVQNSSKTLTLCNIFYQYYASEDHKL